jgi:hypothetical protein
MSEQDDRIDAELARIAQATAPLRPRAGYLERVMAAVHAESLLGWRHELVRSARRLVPLAGIAAAAALTWAVVSERSTDEAFASWDDSVELEW